MEKRVYNFSPGPAVLPLPVLEEAQRDLLALPGTGISILEISHRSKAFEKIINQAEANLRTLLGIPDNYRVLFLQGGALLQFGMVPMNLLRGSGKSADYILSGTWSKKAHDEAKTQGPVRVAWDGKPGNFNRVPSQSELKLDANAAYVYLASNETIQGVEFPQEPAVGDVPLVCDASSDFLSRPVAMEKYGILFACAQKNAGPAGVTIVIIRDDLVAAFAGRPAFDGQLQGVGRGQVVVEHPAHVRRLHGQAGDRLAHQRDRRTGQDGRNQPAEGQAALRRDRSVGGFLSGACRAGEPVGDERRLPPGQSGPRRAVCEAGGRARAMRAEGPSLRGRLPSVDLQRHAHRGRATAGRLHERVLREEQVAQNPAVTSSGD